MMNNSNELICEISLEPMELKIDTDLGTPIYVSTDGADGFSPIITETQTASGYDLTITDVNGTNTISILNGEQGIQGVPGEAGHTPEFGVDYWTPEQQQEIISTATTNTINNYSSTITQIQSNASNALNTANTANTTANTAKSIAEGANQALSYANYQAMVTAFNSLDDDVYRVGQNVMIVTLNVPDLWVSSIESTSASYTYTNDEAITTALSTNGYIQIGYYKLSALETQKVDLTDYYTKTGTENKIEDYLYQIMPTDSTSGAITTIDDATTMFNAVDVTGSIEPVQDLNGQENPYPAGGSAQMIPDGKDYDNGYLNGGYLNADGSTSGSGGWYVSEYFAIISGNSYTWSSKSTSVGAASVCFYDENKNYISGESANGELPKVLVAPENAVYCRASQSKSESTVCQIEEGSTATEIKPYSNICPITGWTGVNVVRTGKNLLTTTQYRGGYAFAVNNDLKYKTASSMTETDGDYSINITSAWGGVLFATGVLKAGTYKVSFTSSDTNLRGSIYVTNENLIIKNSVANIASSGTSRSVTVSEGDRIAVYIGAGVVAVVSLSDIQVEYGSTKTNYEAYIAPSTYIFDWTSEASTVYGGSLDVTTGVLTVTHAELTLTDSTGFTIDSTSESNTVFKKTAATPHIPNEQDEICNIFVKHLQAYIADDTRSNTFILGSSKKLYLQIPSSTASTLEELNSFIEANPVQIVYELAEPITYQLTPQQISFLLGTNNLWVNTGDISVTYKADIQKYINKKTN